MNDTVFLLLFIPAIVLTACNSKSTSSAPIAENRELVKATHKKIKSQVEEIQKTQVRPPNTVYIAIDGSGSMKNAAITPTTMADIEPVLKSVTRTGGTLALGIICDRSNRPLLRETFSEVPRLNITSVPKLPQLPDTSRGNPFKHKKSLKAYNQANNTYKDQIANIAGELKSYQQKLANHSQEHQKRLNALKPQIEGIIRQPRNCQATDIQKAVQRANWLFNEPSIWSQIPRKYAVFVTDGLDTFSNQPIEKLKADRVLLVSGSSNGGVFQNTQYQRFESPNAAFSTLAQWLVQ